MFQQDAIIQVINTPAPEFDDIGYAGDGRYFLLSGNDGNEGMVPVSQPQGSGGYNSSLNEVVDGMNYSKFYCDYLITEKAKIQTTDLKVTNAGVKDFLVLEILFQYNADPELWMLGKRFVKRFYLSTDFEDQDTPELPYAKLLESGVFMIRVVYYKHESNTKDIDLRCNYGLHGVD